MEAYEVRSMKSVSTKDRGVSEVIGFVLVFAIFISIFSTLVTYYVPATESAYESNYQAASMYAMSKFSSSLSTPGYITGQVLNNYVPLGIQGGIFSPSRQTSVSYSSGGLSGSISYGLGVSFAYSQTHPTNAVLNKLVQTFPKETLSNPVAELFQPSGYLYVAGYDTNNLAVIDPYSGAILTYAYAGGHPKAMTFGAGDSNIFVLDNLTLSARNYTYFTVSEVSTVSNKFVANATIQQANTSKQPPATFDVASITYDPTNNYLYVAYLYHLGNGVGSYKYNIVIIDASTLQVVGSPVSYTDNIFDLAYDQNGYLVALFDPLANSTSPQYSLLNPTSLNFVANISIDFPTFYSTYGYNGDDGAAPALVPLLDSYSAYLLTLNPPSNRVSISLQSVYPDGSDLYFAFNITSPTQSTLNNGLVSRDYLPAPGIVSVAFTNVSTTVQPIAKIAQFYSSSTITPETISDSSMYSGVPQLGLGATVVSSVGRSDFVFDFNLSGFYNFNSADQVTVS